MPNSIFYLQIQFDKTQGDSGGPLFDSSMGLQVGITSFGPTQCEAGGVYTRVSAYDGWIKEKMGVAVAEKPDVPPPPPAVEESKAKPEEVVEETVVETETTVVTSVVEEEVDVNSDDSNDLPSRMVSRPAMSITNSGAIRNRPSSSQLPFAPVVPVVDPKLARYPYIPFYGRTPYIYYYDGYFFMPPF